MLVSILVPIYKVEKYIERCLTSIFNQTYPEIEYVFVDDCSPDNSLKILKYYISIHNIKNNITIISHAKNMGIAITRNDLLDNSKGEYVLFIDSDDWVELDMVEQMVCTTQNGTIDIVGCDYIKEFCNGEKNFQYEQYSNDCKENVINILNYNIGPTLWKLLINKKLFENIRFIKRIEIGEDYIASVKLFYYAYSCSYIHKYLYHYSQININRYTSQIAKSISDHTQAVIEVEFFLKNQGFYNNKIEKEIRLRKFSIKSYYLSPILLDYKKWENTFPEANKMWRYINFTTKEKIKYWLAEKHLYIIITLCWDLIGFIKKFKKNNK